jgi:hypothetical protein
MAKQRTHSSCSMRSSQLALPVPRKCALGVATPSSKSQEFGSTFQGLPPLGNPRIVHTALPELGNHSGGGFRNASPASALGAREGRSSHTRREPTPVDESSRQFKYAMSILSSDTEDKDFSMLMLSVAHFEQFIAALQCRTGCKSVDFTGASMNRNQAMMLRDAVVTNPSPICQCILTDSAVLAFPEIVTSINVACLQNRMKVEDAAEKRAQELNERRQALYKEVALTCSKELMEEKGHRIAEVRKRERKEREQLQLAFRFAVDWATKVSTIRRVHEESHRDRKAIVKEWEQHVAVMKEADTKFFLNLVEVEHKELAEKISKREHLERKWMWSFYCQDWNVATSQMKRRFQSYDLQKEAVNLEASRKRLEITNERWNEYLILCDQWTMMLKKLEKQGYEQRLRHEEEQRKLRLKTLEEVAMLERQREKERLEREKREAHMARDYILADREYSRIRMILEEAESIAFHSLKSVSKLHEKIAQRHRRFSDLHRMYFSALKEMPKLRLSVPTLAEPSIIHRGQFAPIPIEPRVHVDLAMDVLWPIRTMVLRQELHRLLPQAVGAKAEIAPAFSPFLLEAEGAYEKAFNPETLIPQWGRTLARNRVNPNASTGTLSPYRTSPNSSSSNSLSSFEARPVRSPPKTNLQPPVSPGLSSLEVIHPPLMARVIPPKWPSKFRRYMEEPYYVNQARLDMGLEVRAIQSMKEYVTRGSIEVKLADRQDHRFGWMLYQGTWPCTVLEEVDSGQLEIANQLWRQSHSNEPGPTTPEAASSQNDASSIREGFLLRIDIPTGASPEQIETELRLICFRNCPESADLQNIVVSPQLLSVEVNIFVDLFNWRRYNAKPNGRVQPVPLWRRLQSNFTLTFCLAPPVISFVQLGENPLTPVTIRHDARKRAGLLFKYISIHEPPQVERYGSLSIRLLDPSKAKQAWGPSETNQEVVNPPQRIRAQSLFKDFDAAAPPKSSVHQSTLSVTFLDSDPSEDLLCLLDDSLDPDESLAVTDDAAGEFQSRRSGGEEMSFSIRRRGLYLSNGVVFIERREVARVSRPPGGLNISFSQDVQSKDVTRVLGRVGYSNKNLLDPTHGVRTVLIEGRNSRGLALHTKIFVDVFARDEPTRWRATATELIYRAPLETKVPVNAPFIQLLQPSLLRIGDKIELIDDDTTFFAGGYFSCRIATEAYNRNEEGLFLMASKGRCPFGLSFVEKEGADSLVVDDRGPEAAAPKADEEPMPIEAYSPRGADSNSASDTGGSSNSGLSPLAVGDEVTFLEPAHTPSSFRRTPSRVLPGNRTFLLYHDGYYIGDLVATCTGPVSATGHVLASSLRLDFSTEGTATMDSIEMVLKALCFTRTSLSIKAEERIAVDLELLVGETIGRRDIHGNPLPPSDENVPLTLSLNITSKPSMLTLKPAPVLPPAVQSPQSPALNSKSPTTKATSGLANKGSNVDPHQSPQAPPISPSGRGRGPKIYPKERLERHYVENSGYSYPFRDLEEVPHGFFGGYISGSIVDGRDEFDIFRIIFPDEIQPESGHRGSRTTASSTQQKQVVEKGPKISCSLTKGNALSHLHFVSEASKRREDVQRRATIALQSSMAADAAAMFASPSVANFGLRTQSVSVFPSEQGDQPEEEEGPASPAGPEDDKDPFLEMLAAAKAKRLSKSGRRTTIAEEGEPNGSLEASGKAAEPDRWGLRSRRISLCRREHFVQITNKSAAELVNDRKQRLADVGLNEQFLSPFVNNYIFRVDDVTVGRLYVHPQGSFTVVFNADYFVTPELVSAVLRRIAYRNTSRNPQILEKTLQLDVNGGNHGTSTSIRWIIIDPVDDPTEITLRWNVLKWRCKASGCEPLQRPLITYKPKPKAAPVSAATKVMRDLIQPVIPDWTVPQGVDRLSVVRLFPMEGCTVFDPDTDHWDGGSIKVTQTSGLSTLDSLRLLTMEEQAAIYRLMNLNPERGTYVLSEVAAGNSTIDLHIVNYAREILLPHVATVADSRATPAGSNTPTAPPISEDTPSRTESPQTASLAILPPVQGSNSLTVSFSPAEHIYARRVTITTLETIIRCICLDSQHIPESLVIKSFEIAVTDVDNLANPGKQSVSVEVYPPPITLNPAMPSPAVYSIRQALEGKPEFLMLGCAVGWDAKEKFQNGVIEIYPVSGFAVKDLLLARFFGTGFLSTQDGLVICNKELVCRAPSLTGTHIRFEFSRDCKGATGRRIQQLLQCIAFLIDIKDVKEKETVPVNDRIICVTVAEQYKDGFERSEAFTLPIRVCLLENGSVQAPPPPA